LLRFHEQMLEVCRQNLETMLLAQEVPFAVPKMLPSVSIIISVDGQWNNFGNTRKKLKSMMNEAEEQLLENYLLEKATPVIEKLRHLAKGIDFSVGQKGLAVYASLTDEKVYQLPFEVKEKLIIDESFEVRDLLFSVKNNFNYLVLVLSHKQAKLFYGVNDHVVIVNAGLPGDATRFLRDLPSKIANYSDKADVRDTELERFLHHVDEVLTKLIQQYAVSIFVMGVDEVIGHFRKLTRNNQFIMAHIHGNFDNASTTEISKALVPALKEWYAVRNELALRMLEAADRGHKLTKGIMNVWRDAAMGKGFHLVVERDFHVAAIKGSDGISIFPLEESTPSTLIVKDAVDDLIEMVLKFGGDVTFVEDGQLSKYNRVALILRY